MRPQLHSRASAFGKVILFGEHSVVYGYPALAAGIADGVVLHAQPTEHGRPLELSIPDWDVDFELRPESEDPLSLALHAIMSHCDGPLTGWRITGQTKIPARAGCGSSAALSVALAKLALGEDAPPAQIVEASMAGERVFHGNPSGLDSEIATRGGMLRYTRSDGVAPLRFAPFTVVVANTNKPRSTAHQVANVRTRKTRFPLVVDPVLQALGQLVTSAERAIVTNDFKSLGELMEVSHELLSGLGVCCEELDRLVALANRSGALGAKLTGAGGGGCIIALPGDGAGPLLKAFETAQVEAFEVRVEA